MAGALLLVRKRERQYFGAETRLNRRRYCFSKDDDVCVLSTWFLSLSSCDIVITKKEINIKEQKELFEGTILHGRVNNAGDRIVSWYSRTSP